jgi:phage-related protein
MAVAFHYLVWEELSQAEPGLRAACKARLHRLGLGQTGGLRLEKVHKNITELKVSWNKQEFRLLFFWGANRTAFMVVFLQKKTPKTPTAQIDLAVKRMKEVQLDQTVAVSSALH